MFLFLLAKWISFLWSLVIHWDHTSSASVCCLVCHTPAVRRLSFKHVFAESILVTPTVINQPVLVLWPTLTVGFIIKVHLYLYQGLVSFPVSVKINNHRNTVPRNDSPPWKFSPCIAFINGIKCLLYNGRCVWRSSHWLISIPGYNYTMRTK